MAVVLHTLESGVEFWSRSRWRMDVYMCIRFFLPSLSNEKIYIHILREKEEKREREAMALDLGLNDSLHSVNRSSIISIEICGTLSISLYTFSPCLGLGLMMHYHCHLHHSFVCFSQQEDKTMWDGCKNMINVL